MLVFRLPSSTRHALQTAAADQQRSLSNMTFVIVSEWLKSNGYSAESPKGSTSRRRKG